GEQLTIADERNVGRVVPAVLEPAEAVDHDIEGRLRADVPHDSAHGDHPSALRADFRSACTMASVANEELSPYVELDRATWAALAESMPLPLSADEVERLRGLGDFLDLDEVSEVYLPI